MSRPEHSKPDHSGRHDGPIPLVKGTTPEATYVQVDRVEQLLRDLSVLVTHALTSVGQASKSLQTEVIVGAASVGAVESLLKSASEGLTRMSELVHAAMQGKAMPLGATDLKRARPVTLGEAVAHAADVCRPLAAQHGITIYTSIAALASTAPAGAMYTVALNAVQNAIEAAARRPGAGRVEIELNVDHPPAEGSYGRDARTWWVFEVRDDGAGLAGNIDASRVFDLGYTTKRGGAGVGLAVARSIVQGAGGQIELVGRSGEHGCVLRVRFPGVVASRKIA